MSNELAKAAYERFKSWHDYYCKKLEQLTPLFGVQQASAIAEKLANQYYGPQE